VAALRERSGLTLRTGASRVLAQRLAVPFLIVVSLVLIVVGKADLVMVARIRVATGDVMAPVLTALARPAASLAAEVRNMQGLFALYRENARLRQDNERLMQWQALARRLATENERLRALSQYQPRGAKFSVTAQVVAVSGGAFARSVLVDAGTRDGVARGQAVSTGEGLIGRVAEVGERTARILLLSDLNSRIPVVVGASGQHAMLAGDNSNQPLLQFLPLNSPVKVGDRVVTGGAQGVFPPDLPVGTIASIDRGQVRVAPYAALTRIDYVRIVDLGLSAFLPQAVAPPTPHAAAKPAAPDRGAQ
jgi:rod shape-determining protein MreC